MTPTARPQSRSKCRTQPVWSRWSAERLLEARLCDLGVCIERSPLERRIDQLHRELRQRNILFKPYFWLSDEWFTPAGITGTAIPFYLAHPRLIRLQRNQTGEAEGTNRDWCMKILRHEAGHALDHAYRLNRRRKRQELFGLSSKRYPRHYRPNPYSKRHVQHLQYWYAQSHPDEDFAETFAVWLAPRSQWRQRYRDWPVMRKLEYMDSLMSEISGIKPKVSTRARVDPMSRLTGTLREHYERYREGPASLYPAFYDRDLLKLFCSQRKVGRERAAAFIRRVRVEVVGMLMPWTGEYRYQLDHVIDDMIGRCRELKLFVTGPDSRNKSDLIILFTKHTMNSLFRHRRWVEM